MPRRAVRLLPPLSLSRFAPQPHGWALCDVIGEWSCLVWVGVCVCVCGLLWGERWSTCGACVLGGSLSILPCLFRGSFFSFSGRCACLLFLFAGQPWACVGAKTGVHVNVLGSMEIGVMKAASDNVGIFLFCFSS